MQTAQAFERIREEGAAVRVVTVRRDQRPSPGKSDDDGGVIEIARLSAQLNEIADLFAGDSRPREAIWWYSAALNCRSHAADGDFESPFDLSLRPLLGLTVCLWETGDKAGAVDAHRRAAALFPDHPAVRFNAEFFHARGLL